MGEFELIRLLTSDLTYDERTVVGVGDDCAVYEISKGRYLLATCDMLIEDVHFSRKTASPFLIGCKAIAGSLSDIAAMGGRPLFTLAAIGLPESISREFVQDLYVGMRSICRDFALTLAGGDTVRSPEKVVIDISMLGESPNGKFVLRSGAKAGDIIAVTGFLGDSAAGLDLLNGKLSETDTERRNALIEAHLAPEPRSREGLFLNENFQLHSMIDVSDGLAGDLGHICEMSKVGARIWSSQIPLSDPLRDLCRNAGRDPLEYALSGGEDYELLFTLKPGEFTRMEQRWKEKFDIPLSSIGEVDTSIEGIRIVSPKGEEPLKVHSFDHFKR
jgi:thiamine-monophosphate kinase